MSAWTLEDLLSGKRKLWFGVILTLVLAGTAVLPDVDQSIKNYHELGRLRAGLATRDNLPERARTLAARVSQLEENSLHWENILVPPEKLSRFKQDLTQMASSADCRLRSIHPGAASRRPLNEVLGRPVTSAPGTSSAWQVKEQVSAVSLQGSFGNLVTFLSSLDRVDRALSIAGLHLRSRDRDRDELVLDLQIKTLNLVRGSSG